MTVLAPPIEQLVTFDPIAGAVTAQVSTAVVPKLGRVESANFYAVFAYGAGGTTCKCWVQTTLDDAATWVDIACFAFTTAAARKGLNLPSTYAQATPITFVDGALADNTSVPGFLGHQFRTKITTTGTYSGATSLNVYGVFR